MTEIKDWILKYGIALGRRFYDREKRKFLGSLMLDFKKMGFSVKVSSEKKLFSKKYAFTAGNVEQAETVLLTYFDTPNKTIKTRPYCLFGSKKTLQKEKLLFSTIFTSIAATAGFFLIRFIQKSIDFTGGFTKEKVLFFLLISIFFYILVHFNRGGAKKFNLVRNTSSIITTLLIAEKLTEKQKKKVAFVFYDFGCLQSVQEDLFLKIVQTKLRCKKIIMLDSVGSEDKLLMLLSDSFFEKNKKESFYQKHTGTVLPLAKFGENRQRFLSENLLIVTSGRIVDKTIQINYESSIRKTAINQENIHTAAQLILGVI